MVHARRLAAARLSDPVAVKKLFDDIAPRFEESPRWLYPNDQAWPTPRGCCRNGDFGIG